MNMFGSKGKLDQAKVDAVVDAAQEEVPQVPEGDTGYREPPEPILAPDLPATSDAPPQDPNRQVDVIVWSSRIKNPA